MIDVWLGLVRQNIARIDQSVCPDIGLIFSISNSTDRDDPRFVNFLHARYTERTKRPAGAGTAWCWFRPQWRAFNAGAGTKS
jgi:hypothetical protein